MGQVERNKRGTWLQALWFASDFGAIVLGCGIGYWIRFDSPLANLIPVVNGSPPISIYVLGAGVTIAVWLPLFHALGLYRLGRGRMRHRRTDIVRGIALGVLILAGLGFFYRGASFSRAGMLIIWSVTTLFIIFGRTGIQLLLRRWSQLRPIRFAIVGSGILADRVVTALARSPFPHQFVGYFGDDGDAPVPVEVTAVRSAGRTTTTTAGSADSSLFLGRSDPDQQMTSGSFVSGVSNRLGTSQEIQARARSVQLDLVVMVGQSDQLESVYQQCRELDLDFQLVPEVLSLLSRRVHVEDIDGVPLLRMRDLPLVGWNGVIKRTIDLIFSALLLIGLSPVFLFLALAVKLSSPGPVFHRQERVGRDRRPFDMIKFRSMRVDAESTSGPVWAAENDPRRTRIGVFLRKWSLDELPQFWNVLRGQMSLVGPRPERPVFVEQFEERLLEYYDRHRVKSGVTGWAQVHGLRGNVPIEDRTRYDLWYVENWSLGLDFRILWLTLRAVVAYRGE